MEYVSTWKIKYLNEEQVLEKPEYGVKFIIPPSSLKEGQEVKIQVNVVTPEESDIILPPYVELVSCLYEIKTTGKFSRPVELYIQHNVVLKSQEECQQLAFIRSKGQPPYEFELFPTKYDQVFRPYDNYGVIEILDFSRFGITKRIMALFQHQLCKYAMTVFFEKKETFCWEIQAVVTKDLGPLLEVCNHDEKRTTTPYYPSINVLYPC